MALQQQAQANFAAAGASIHEVSPTTSPIQNTNNMQSYQQAQKYAARLNHVQANVAGPSNAQGYPIHHLYHPSNQQPERPQVYLHPNSYGVPQQPGGSTSSGHIGQDTGIARGWANGGPSGAIPQPSINSQSGAARPVSVSVSVPINARTQQMRSQAANTDTAQEAAEWERSLNAIPINGQGRSPVTQAPPGNYGTTYPRTQTSVAQSIAPAEQRQPGGSNMSTQSSALQATQSAPSAPNTSNSPRPPNHSLTSGSGGGLQHPRPQPPFAVNSGGLRAPPVSSPTVQAPQNGTLTTPTPSISAAPAAQLQPHRLVQTHPTPSDARPSISRPTSAQVPPPTALVQAPNYQPVAPPSSTTGSNTQMPSSSLYAHNVQRKTLVHSFLAALGKRKALAADIEDSSEGPNKRRAGGSSAATPLQVHPPPLASAPIATSVLQAKPSPALTSAPAPAPARTPAPAPALTPAPVPGPASTGTSTSTDTSPIPYLSSASTKDRHDTIHSRLCSRAIWLQCASERAGQAKCKNR